MGYKRLKNTPQMRPLYKKRQHYSEASGTFPIENFTITAENDDGVVRTPRGEDLKPSPPTPGGVFTTFKGCDSVGVIAIAGSRNKCPIPVGEGLRSTGGQEMHLFGLPFLVAGKEEAVAHRHSLP